MFSIALLAAIGAAPATVPDTSLTMRRDARGCSVSAQLDGDTRLDIYNNVSFNRVEISLVRPGGFDGADSLSETGRLTPMMQVRGHTGDQGLSMTFQGTGVLNALAAAETRIAYRHGPSATAFDFAAIAGQLRSLRNCANVTNGFAMAAYDGFHGRYTAVTPVR